MPYERWLYETADNELYKTDGYGGSDADVSTSVVYTDTVDLTDYLGAVVDIVFDGSDATDNLSLYLYKRRDDTWDGDEIAVWSGTITSDGSEDIYHFTIDESYGPGYFRFGLVSAGATTTFDIDAQMRRYRRRS